MKVKIEDQTYYVLFQLQEHNPPLMLEAVYTYSHGKKKGQPKKLAISHTTLCIIKGAPTSEELTSLNAKLIVSSEVWCSTKDVFDLHEGRRTALTRALAELNDKPEYQHVPRKPFWNEFLKFLPKPEPTVRGLKRQVRLLQEQVAKIADSQKGRITTFT